MHDKKLKYGVWRNIDAARPLRYAIEIRHSTFLVSEFFALLREYKVAFVFADAAGKWPYAEDLTADFVYIRLHGATELYTSGYSDSELDWWRARIESWRHGRQPKDARLILPGKSEPRKRDVYVYFDNDAKVHAPFDAKTLSERVRLPSIRT